MSDQASIFQDNSQTLTATTPPADHLAALANQLASIKNESGEQKYKTLDDAMKALAHSQQYIPTLTKTLAEKEAELAQAKAAADKVAELERTVQQLLKPADSPASSPANTAITPEAIAEIVKRTISTNQEQESATKNLQSVVSAAKQQFGDKADEIFYSKATALGMSKQEINSLAAKSPAAVLELLGLKQSSNNQSFANSTYNSNAFQPGADTLIGRNTKPLGLGATTQDMQAEGAQARKMVEELHAQGKTISDLTDPKVYFKHFS